LPELVVTGLRDAPAAGLRNEVARRVLHHHLLAGQRLSASGRPVHVLAVARPHDHLLTATALYGDAVRA